MNYSNALNSVFITLYFIGNAQNNDSHQNSLVDDEKPEVIAKKVDSNTVIYKYSKKNKKDENKQTLKELENSSAEKEELFEYPIMRAKQGAVLPFEIIYNGKANTKAGIAAQKFYFNSLMTKPEQNKIIYQDIGTTKERLNNAGLFDSKDLNYFDMPLIAKIVGAGVLITAKIMVSNTTQTTSNTGIYTTQIIFKIYNKNGKTIFLKKEAPFTSTTLNSYQNILEKIMKQTPFYYN